MGTKKSPKADLNRNSGLYFVIGLSLVLLFTWRVMEYKTYETSEEIVQVLNIQEDLKEDMPITEAIKTPPPPSAPEVVEIVGDEAEIEETSIVSSEMDQETVIEAVMAVDDVEVAEEEEEITVSFAVIQNAAIFPGCESMKTNNERKACFQKWFSSM
jgi:protein TonB